MRQCSSPATDCHRSDAIPKSAEVPSFKCFAKWGLFSIRNLNWLKLVKNFDNQNFDSFWFTLALLRSICLLKKLGKL